MITTRAKGEKAFDDFVDMFEPKYPGAAACLMKDRDVLLTFYDFPAEHWIHIRTTNPIADSLAPYIVTMSNMNTGSNDIDNQWLLAIQTIAVILLGCFCGENLTEAGVNEPG